MTDSKRVAVNAFLDSPAADNRESWRVWFRDAIQMMCSEKELFSGKRPVANSGWFDDLNDSLKSHKVSMPEVLSVLFDRPAT